MSPSLWAALDGLLQDQYKQCWSYLGMSSGQRYIPQIKVEYAKDGALVGQPSLLNPPSDPSLNTLAESAVRAVRRCNPLKIPAQYQPYFEQWRARILRFDPDEMQG
jgi:colicin import membrane protein